MQVLQVKPRKDTAEPVVRRNAMGQLQELAEPRLLGLAPLLDFDPVVGSTNRAQDRDGEDG
jgi:hypothetical protein